jgi:hypothetical protein
MTIPTLVASDVPKKRRYPASRNSPGERHHLPFLDPPAQVSSRLVNGIGFVMQ